MFDLNRILSNRNVYLPELLYVDTKLQFDLSSSSFICDNCLKKSGKTRKENKFAAKSKLRLVAKQQRLLIKLNVPLFT